MAEISTIHSTLNSYSPNSQWLNEILAPDITLHPEWQTFFNSMVQLGESELEERKNDIQRLLKENGVAYNIYNDASGQNRPWHLDPIPKIITAKEWESTNAGLIQRATLFDLMLKDIYGPQRLIKDGIIPQELIYLHPGFLRSCVNVELPGFHRLVLYAADMARGRDGRKWVISDRSQAPSGAGYALENRHAMSTVLPELFNHLRVKRISPYFDALQNALAAIAPGHSDNPRIVILTPGPENETYFEHSYLAAYLGFTLVQGSDLIVRDNFVWLKTIEGLEKIDVILRRLDDVYCDPLELKSTSLLGVPGLMQVVRRGNVALANPLGSSVIENAGLVPFLPAIAKYLLGEKLIMPSIASWWCGQPKELNYVIENLQHLVVRRIYRNEAGTRSTIDGASLSKAQTAELISSIRTNPHLYTGQEKINFASDPTWVGGKVKHCNSLFRGFLVSSGQSYIAIPGGLTRTNTAKENFIISNQLGGNSKDTWVLSTHQEEDQPITLQVNKNPLWHPIHKRSLPSHTAENLFWVGRYTERVIYNARLHRTVMQRVQQSNRKLDANKECTEELLLRLLSICTFTKPGFGPDDKNEIDAEIYKDPWVELVDVLYNNQRYGSLSNNMNLLKHAVYRVRNFWAVDTWRVLRQMEEQWEVARQDDPEDRLKMISSIDALNTSMFAFLGMNRESVRREQGWNILDLGRKLEQCLYTISLIKNNFIKHRSPQVEHEMMESFLIASQSLITYRYTYRDHLQLPQVLELLMLDMNYPKSLAYLVNKIKRYVAHLPKTGNENGISEQERLMIEADTMLKLAKGVTLATHNPVTLQHEELHNFLDKLKGLLISSSTLISKTYFSHSQIQKQLFTTNLL